MSYIAHKQFETAVLFIIFKRLDTTKNVLEVIKKVKPSKLYIAADGPRDFVHGEKEKVEKVRDYVISNIDWPCNVKTLFREKNLGCGKSVSEAITWFFNNENEGIILEDDIVPSLSFFRYCEDLLIKYKNDKRIWHISGFNCQNGIKRGDGDYYFSAYGHVWGWATWADRWKYYEYKLDSINNNVFLYNYFDTKKEIRYWNNILKIMKSYKPIDTWDYQWNFIMWKYGGFAILPNKNMISNIGFGPEGTHTLSNNSPFSNMDRFDLNLLKHPSIIKIDRNADKYTFNVSFDPLPIYKRIINKFKRIIGILKNKLKYLK